jgi:hypothetical protein
MVSHALHRAVVLGAAQGIGVEAPFLRCVQQVGYRVPFAVPIAGVNW